MGSLSSTMQLYNQHSRHLAYDRKETRVCMLTVLHKYTKIPGWSYAETL